MIRRLLCTTYLWLQLMFSSFGAERNDPLISELKQVMSNYVYACQNHDIEAFLSSTTTDAVVQITRELQREGKEFCAENLVDIQKLKWFRKELSLPVARVDSDGEYARVILFENDISIPDRPDLKTRTVYWFFKRESEKWKFVSNSGMIGSDNPDFETLVEADISPLFQLQRGTFRFIRYDFHVCAAISKHDVDSLIALVRTRSTNVIESITRAEHPTDIRVPVVIGIHTGYSVRVGNPFSDDFMVDVMTTIDPRQNYGSGETFMCIKSNAVWTIYEESEWIE